MTGKSIKLNKRQKEVLKALLDKFEKSKTYRGENAVNQSFKVKPSDFFRDYDSDFANLDEQEDFERELRGLEDAGLIQLSKKNGVIKSIDMVPAALDFFYSLLGRTELKELENSQIAMYESHLGKYEVVDLFCKTQIKRLEERKKAEYEMPVAREILNILDYICSNTDEILERELSIELFGDSKRFEREYRSKILTVLRKYGDFNDLIENVPDDREQGHAILAEYYVFPNPTYVNFKEYCKPLENNDVKKAQSLIDKGLYVDTMRYMLENDVKLEQEVISWKQEV